VTCRVTEHPAWKPPLLLLPPIYKLFQISGNSLYTCDKKTRATKHDCAEKIHTHEPDKKKIYCSPCYCAALPRKWDARARARGTRLWIMRLSRSRGTRNALNTPWRNIATRGRDSIASRIAKYLNESGNFYSGCQFPREKLHEQIALPESRIQACSHKSGTEIGGRSFVTTRVLKLVYRSELRNSGRELANFARSWTQ